MGKGKNVRFGIGAQILAAALLIVVLFSLTNAYVFLRVQEFEKNYEEMLAYSTPVVHDVQEISTELWRQGAQVRGYILTGEPKLLDSYRQSQSRMGTLLAGIEKRMRSDEDKRELHVIQMSVGSYNQTLNQAIIVREKMGLAEALKLLAVSGDRAGEMDKLTQQFIDYIQADLAISQQANSQAVQTMKRTVLGAVGAVFILAVICALWLSRRIARPLAGLAIAADAIAGGDLSRKTVISQGNDEIADLIHSFSTMTENLRSLVSQVARASEQLASSSEQLTASASQTSQSAEQVADTVTEVAGGAASQVDAVEQSIAVVKEMNAAVSRIASTVSNASSQSAAAAGAAQSGDEAVKRAAEQMDVIYQTVNRTTDVVRTLGVSSQQIGEIVEVITGIAGQTNLLALNAAIEAARAGDAGRGFSVVADEVRKLAEQSEAAAHKIGSIINSIQAETGTAVGAMEQGMKEVTVGNQVIAATGERFRQIIDMVRGVDNHIRDISHAAAKLSDSSGQVETVVGGVKSIAADTAGNTQTISAAVEEQSATMQQIAASSQALSTMAEELQSIVAKFRL